MSSLCKYFHKIVHRHTSAFLRGLALLLTTLVCFFASQAGYAAEPAGRLVSATGDVSAISKTKVSRNLKVGDSVEEGETLKCKDASSAKFLMSDQTIMDLSPASQLLVEHFEMKSVIGDRDVSVAVLTGTIRMSVNQHLSTKGKFQVRTRTATMGVRGTEFVVQNDFAKGESKLTVLEGLVQATASAPGSTPMGVSPGNQFTVKQGSSPQLVSLSASQLASVAKSATVKDRTFSSAVEIKKSSSGSSGATSAATSSILSSVGQTASRSPASQSGGASGHGATAAIPGNVETLRALRSQTALMQVQNVKLNIGFTQ